MLRHKKIKPNTAIWLTVVALAVLSLPVAATAQDVNDFNVPDFNLPEDPNLEAEPQFPGTVEGTGTYFELTDSNYIDITFESTEPVHLRLESVPRMVTMDIEAANDANSTQITLGGFDPETTYYMYEDDYHNLTELTTDANGSCGYTQDLTQRHLIFIQPSRSTIFLSDTGWSNPVGTWDPITKTGTLTQDVYETIQIDSSGVTLDGNGFSAIGSGTGHGVYLYKRSSVTITNLTVEGFSNGISLYQSNTNTLTDNTVNSNNGIGIRIFMSSSNVLTGNSMSGNGSNFRISGLYTAYFNNNIDTSNTVEGRPIYYIVDATNEVYDNTTAPNAGVFYAIGCDNITIKDLTLASNNSVGVFLSDTENSTIENVTVSSIDRGIHLSYSNSNILTNNTTNSNNTYGIFLNNSQNNTLTSNTASNNSHGISLSFSTNNTITDCNSTDNDGDGINLYNCSNNTLTNNNTLNNSRYGIYISSSSSTNTLTGNVSNNNSYGIYIISGSGNTLRGNSMSGNQYNFYVQGWQSSDFYHDVDMTNMVEGKSIYYLVNEVGGIYDSTTAGDAGVFYAIDCNNITIKDLTPASNNYAGVYLFGTENSTIENVTISNSSQGIRVEQSSNNTLISNTVNSNVYDGIYLYHSSSNTLISNIANSNYNGINVSNSNGNTLISNTANSNNYVGIYLAFGSSNNTLTGNTAESNGYGIALTVNCSNNTLTNNTANSNINFGISLYNNCIDNMLISNTVSNSRYGYYIYHSNGNTLTGNSANSNNYGIWIRNSSDNTLSDNTANSNSYGIYVSDYFNYSSNNLIYNNNFINNTTQARVVGGSTGNVFNLSKAEGGGNYWNDWTSPDGDADGFVDVPYVFNGGQDNLPLVSPVVLETEPPVVTEIDYDENIGTTVSGTAGPGADITIYDGNGEVLCTTTADDDGNWECIIQDDLEGQVITVTASGPGGESPPTQPPAAPVIGVVDYDEGAGTTTVAGTAEPGAVITIYDEIGDVLCETIADENGDWECVVSGNHQGDITVTASDEDGNTSPAANVPPVADAGADQIVTDDTWPLGYEEITLDGSGSYDPDGTIVSYSWSQGGTPIAVGAAPTLSFDIGLYTLDLTVTDNDGAADTSSVVITVLQADPAVMISALTDEVESFNLQQGIANSFDAKLQNVQDALTAANAGLRQDAINKLEAFKAACEAQRDKMLTSDQADALIRDANYIIETLQQ